MGGMKQLFLWDGEWYRKHTSAEQWLRGTVWVLRACPVWYIVYVTVLTLLS